MTFEEKLTKGEFVIPKCNNCQKIVWPPSKFCNYCFGHTSISNKTNEGKIIEFSRGPDYYFCLVEFEESVRIMAKMHDTPKLGQTVKIQKCGIDKGDYFFIVN